MELLSSHHGTSLLNLELGAYRDTPGSPDGTMNALRALSVKSINWVDRDSQSFIFSVMAHNCMTLRHLDLGNEVNVVNGRDYNYVSFNRNVVPENLAASILRVQIEHEFKTSQPPVYFPNVDSIRLRGLDVRALFRGRIGDREYKLVDFKALESLTLESCKPMKTDFGFLARLDLSRLRFFRVRQEGVALDDFLGLKDLLWGLLPLEALSVLLEGSLKCTDIDLKPILRRHGPSLRALLIDIKLEELVSIQDSKRVWGPQCVMDICGLCPNLVELGMPLDWNNTSEKSFGCREVRGDFS